MKNSQNKKSLPFVKIYLLLNRVRYREEKYQERVEEKKRKEKEMEIEKEEQEKRLEALREKVRPDVSRCSIFMKDKKVTSTFSVLLLQQFAITYF